MFIHASLSVHVDYKRCNNISQYSNLVLSQAKLTVNTSSWSMYLPFRFIKMDLQTERCMWLLNLASVYIAKRWGRQAVTLLYKQASIASTLMKKERSEENYTRLRVLAPAHITYPRRKHILIWQNDGFFLLHTHYLPVYYFLFDCFPFQTNYKFTHWKS